MPSKSFFCTEVTSNGTLNDSLTQGATFLCNSPTVIFEEFVHGGKINMGPLPGTFVAVPDAFNFLSIS